MNEKSGFSAAEDETSGHRVLIIDDNESLCVALGKMVRRMGIEATYRTTLREGLLQANEEPYDVIFLDVNLPDGSGLDIIGQLRDQSFPPEIVIITAYGDEDGAETAIRNKAWDYIQKDTTFKDIKLSLQRAILYRDQKKLKRTATLFQREHIIGQSPCMTECLEKAARAAENSHSPVFVLGESGTGKELIARAIHDNSARSDQNFVVVDCAAFPEHLVESILFGHKKGAFTGADKDSQGLVLQADKGTLFLDEVGELPLGVQKKFLRVLQEKRFRPVGGQVEMRSDFRVICATHRNITELVEQKLFRHDLYYRLNSINIELPPLRHRKEDIHALVTHFIGRRQGVAGTPEHNISTEFLESLRSCDWPGNVRELFNTLDSVLAEATEETVLFPRHLPTHLRVQAVRNSLKKKADGPADSTQSDAPQPGKQTIPLKKYLDDMRYQYIKDLMSLACGNVSEACRLAEISRGHLYELLKKYNLR